MALVSATRITIRFMPRVAFLALTLAIARKMKRMDGYLDGAILAEGRGMYWTLTAWRDEEAMLAFRKAEPHAKGMRKSRSWATDMHATRWEQDGPMPAWETAADRLRLPAPQSTRGQIQIPARGRASG